VWLFARSVRGRSHTSVSAPANTRTAMNPEWTGSRWNASSCIQWPLLAQCNSIQQVAAYTSSRQCVWKKEAQLSHGLLLFEIATRATCCFHVVCLLWKEQLKNGWMDFHEVWGIANGISRSQVSSSQANWSCRLVVLLHAGLTLTIYWARLVLIIGKPPDRVSRWWSPDCGLLAPVALRM